jgi:alpha-tubulin suppressor-like RCC1 family protein
MYVWLLFHSGLDYTICVMKDGSALGFGAGAKGRLGLGDDFDAPCTKNPCHIELNLTTITGLGTNVATCAAADQSGSSFSVHSICVMKDGSAMSFGDGEAGKLGVGNETTYFSPKPLVGNCMPSMAPTMAPTMTPTVGNSFSGALGSAESSPLLLMLAAMLATASMMAGR